MITLTRKNIEDIVALTPLQEGMLFHYLEAPGSSFYHEQLCLELAGAIDVHRFEQAWQVVVDSNEMLRAVFRWEKMEKPARLILKKHPLNLRCHDLSHLEEEKKKNRLAAIKAADQNETFDLHQVPFRLTLIKVAEDRSMMMIGNHHILYDGWSCGIILEEFFKAYRDLTRGKIIKKPAKTKFKEYGKGVQNQDQQGQEKFWKNYLHGVEPLEFSLKRNLPVEGPSAGGTIRFSFSAAEKKRWEKFVRDQRLTLGTLMTTAWGIVLQKYNNSDDVLFGTTVSGRSAKVQGIEEMVGLFINTIPLRVQALSGETVLELLQRIHGALKTREPYEHWSQVKIKEYSRLAPHETLFDSIVVLENYPLHAALNPKNRAENREGVLSILSYSMTEMPHYPLTLGITLFDEIACDFLYRKDALQDGAVQRLALHFKRIVRALAESPGQEAAHLEMLSAEEKQQLLRDFNDTAADYPGQKIIPQLFAEQVERTPDNTALVGGNSKSQIPNPKGGAPFGQINAFSEGHFTYRELYEKSDRLAGILRDKGAKLETIVGLMVERSLEMVIGILGILKAGAAYLPIDPEYPQERAKYMLTDSAVKILLSTTDISEFLSSPQALLNLSAGHPFNFHPSTLPPFHPSSLAYLIYTSGSTGKPKGVATTHGNVIAYLHAFEKEFQLGERDIVLQQASYSFDAFVEEIYPILLKGGKLAVAAKEIVKDLRLLPKFILRQGITVITCSPLMLNEFNHPDWLEALGSVHTFISGGDVLRAEYIDHLLKIGSVYNTYGPTEATVCAAYYRCSIGSPPPVPIGKPIANYRVYILDRKLNLLPIGAAGELCISGPGLARGYLNNPELTTEKFIPVFYRSYRSYKSYISEKIYKTGDLARWLEDGNIEFLGRIDGQVKIRGFRIELGEIEGHLLKHEKIKEAVVIARGKAGEQYLCAYIAPGHNVQGAELREYLAGKLPDYMIPAYFVPIRQIPLTPAGKPDRGQLPEPGLLAAQAYTAPGNEVEKALVEIWSGILGIQKAKIGISDNFFGLGGHSLRALRLAGQIHKAFNVEVPVAELFKRTTVRGIAHYIEKAKKQEYRSIEAVEEKEYYPLVSTQKQFYILQQANPTTISYNIFETLFLEGPLPEEKFETAFRQLIKRHESLRTSFHLVEGDPVQRVHEEAGFNLEYYDPGKLEEIHHSFIRPFDLSQVPLLRVALIKVEAEKHLLGFDAHHIVLDGFSVGILIDEFLAFYQGENLPLLSIQYKDYVHWLLQRKSKKPGNREKTDRLAGLVETELNLPLDYPRPARQTFEGYTLRFEVEAGEKGALQHLALQEGTTLYTLLLSIYNIFLVKISGQENIVVGSPIAGRGHHDLEGLIGLFIKTVVIQNFPSAEKPFPVFLGEVKTNVLDAFAHQEHQYEELLEKITSSRDSAHNPLFDVMFVMQNLDLPGIRIPGLKITERREEMLAAKFDLTLECEVKETLVLSLEYSTRLFKEETIKRFIGYFRQLISSLLENPSGKIAELEIIPAGEKQRILYDFNSGDAGYPRDTMVHGLFEQQVERTPDPVALVGRKLQITTQSGGVQLSYRELDEKANRLAYLLIEKGVLADAIVGIKVERSVDMVIGILGILKAGAAYLPLDPESPEERIRYMLADSAAKLLLSTIDIAEAISAPQVSNRLGAPPPLKGTSFHLHLSPAPITSLAYIIYTSGSTGRPKGVMVNHRSAVNVLFDLQKRYPLNETDAYLLKTPVVFDVSVTELFGWFPGGGRLVLLEVHGEKDPGKILDTIVRTRITHINFIPSMFNVFLEFLGSQKLKQCSSLRYIFLAGEVLLPGVVDKFRCLNRSPLPTLVNLYGPTEGTVYSSQYSLPPGSGEPPGPGIIPIGKPLQNITIYVLNKERSLQPVGIPGELYISGVGLARGYLNNPEMTFEKFINYRLQNTNFKQIPNDKSQITNKVEPFGQILNACGEQFSERTMRDGPKGYSRLGLPAPLTLITNTLYKSGDLVRWLEDGNIEFLNRIDQQVKIRGYRIELGEIENRILTHPQVKEALVVSRTNPTGESYLCAYLVPRAVGGSSPGPGVIPGDHELRRYLAQALPDYMIPAFFVTSGRLPLTATGKLDRKSLPEADINRDSDYTPPANETERLMVKTWADVLGLDQGKIGVHDSFFRLGGHSLKAAALIGKIHKAFAVEIPLGELFKTPTIRHTCQCIARIAKKHYSSIEPSEKKEYYPLSSAQKRLYFLQQMDPESTAYNMPVVLRTEKNVEIEQIQALLRKLIHRHESLRTSFIMVGNEPVQRVHDAVALALEYDEATGDTGISHHAFIRPFDLSKAPLLRSGIITYPDGSHLWLVDLHHIIADGTSTVILREDFSALSRGEYLPELRVRYKDFSGWQNRLFRGRGIKAQEEYWLGLYKDAAGILRLDLPQDYKRPKVFTYAGDHYDLELEGEDTLKFKALSSGSAGTLYMGILALLNTLFYKYNHQTDIIIGTGIAGRPHADLQSIIGMFVNTLAMRNHPQGDKTYETLLKEVIANSVTAFENQDVQFEELVDRLDLERDTSRNPLFDIMMVVQNFQGNNKQELLAVEEYKHTTSKFDLTFFVHEAGDKVRITIEYYTGIFKRETIARLARHWQNLVKAVVANPALKLAELEILTDREKKELLYGFNQTETDYPIHKTICHLVDEQVEKTPNNICLIKSFCGGPGGRVRRTHPIRDCSIAGDVFDNSNCSRNLDLPPLAEKNPQAALVAEGKKGDLFITYRELNETSNHLAHYLYREKSLQPDDRAGILMDPSIERIAAILGVLKAGAAYVPLDPALPEERIRSIIADAGIGVLVSGKRLIRTLNRLQWDCPTLHTFLCIDSWDIAGETEAEKNKLMDEELWKYVAETAVDDITAGGWTNSYTGEPLSKAEMDEYGDNVLQKLTPLLHREMRVLEIGCASGITMYRIAPKVGFYYGTDLSNTIIRKNRERVQQQGWQHIRLDCLPAHEIDKISEGLFDLIIINSVIQCFPGHNYLRDILAKAMGLLRDRGYIFIGDVMDRDLKAELIKDLEAFKRAHQDKNYPTKTDFSSELFIARGFFADLGTENPRVRSVEFTPKTGMIQNELTRFRYDVLLTIDKTTNKDITAKGREKRKYRHDLRALQSWGGEKVKNRPEPHHMAYVIYTSGTTGQPKGVITQHWSLMNLCSWHNRFYNVTEKDRATHLAGFGFDAAVWEVFPYLVKGAALCIIDDETRLDTGRLNEFFESRGITIGFLPTPLCQQFMLENNRSLRVLLTGGDKLHTFVRRSYALYNNYGPTENTVVTTACLVDSDTDMANIPIGKPIDNVKVYILNPSYMALQPVGAAGELCLGGDNLARGYLNDPELTMNKFCLRRPGNLFEKRFPGPSKNFLLDKSFCGGSRGVVFSKRTPLAAGGKIYKTGDLARWLESGMIRFLGRIDRQVKIRGLRIELAEIEQRLADCDEIKEAVVMAREEESGSSYLCAYVVPAVPGLVDENRLAGALAEKLPGYMVPAYFVQVGIIPLTLSGKVDRKALPAPVPALAAGFDTPQNETESRLAAIWAEVLKIDENGGKVGRDSNFFRLGGHSLKATVLAARIHQVLGVKLPLAEIFAYPTPRELARRIKPAAAAKFSSLENTDRKEYYALSSAQKRLYILQQMAPASTAYNISAVLVLTGSIEKQTFAETFKKLIRRHESLRTGFPIIAGEPVQEIRDHVAFEIDEGTRGTREPGPLPGPSAGMVDNLIYPFDFSRAPLLRVGLIHSGETVHILVVDMHHIISDGTSVALFIKEFTALYGGEELAALRLQYKDYAEWQNRWLEQGAQQVREAFWKKQFRGEIPVLNLPVDFPRPSPRGFAGGTVDFEIHPKEIEILKQMASDREMTLYMALLTVFTVFLSKLSGQEDIVIGTPVAGRGHADLQLTMGMFVNTLALRNNPAADKPFHQLLAEIKKSTLGAFENQDYPFETLVERLEVARDLARNPLFDVMLEMQNLDIPEIHLPGLTLAPYPFELKTSQFDLTLAAVEEKDGLKLSFKYCTQLFKEETILRFTGYFQEIVSSVTEDPHRQINGIEILTEEERKRILLDFNDTWSLFPRDKTLHRLFAEQVERTPDTRALVGPESHITNKGGVQLSYREVQEKSARLSSVLKEKGVKPDTIVGIMAERSIEMVIGLYGILGAGGAYLPIDPGYPPERIRYMLDDSAADILLSTADIAGAISAPQFNSHHSSFITHHSANLAYLIYTSGSTGRPKGVMIRHNSLVNRLNWMQSRYPLGKTDVILQKTAFTFDVSVWELFWWGLRGASLCLLNPGDEKNPSAIVEAIARNHVTTMHFVPSMLSLFLAHLEHAAPGSPVGLRRVFASGEALLIQHVEGFNRLLTQTHGTSLVNLYGPTEAAIDVSYWDCPAAATPATIPIGKPIDNICLYILSQQWQIQPLGLGGELCIGGIGLARGYLNNPEMTTEKFIPVFPRSYRPYKSYISKKIYRTGDLARWLADGNIEFLGRLDHQVKIRGFRIEPGEIENRLLAHEAIKEAVVSSIGEGGKSLLASIVSDRELEAAELREYLLLRLPAYMVPSFFKRVERIPLTASGKADREALASSGTHLKASTRYTAPGTPLETRIARIWEEILQVGDGKIGIHDHFFDLGGTSMDVIRVNQGLTREFAREIPMVALYKYTTVHALANLLNHGETEDQGLYSSDKRVLRVEKGRGDRNKMLETRRRARS